MNDPALANEGSGGNGWRSQAKVLAETDARSDARRRVADSGQKQVRRKRDGSLQRIRDSRERTRAEVVPARSLRTRVRLAPLLYPF